MLSVLQVDSDIRLAKESPEKKSTVFRDSHQSSKRDESVGQTVEDMFMRMEAAG
jgi:hypothetical protein